MANKQSPDSIEETKVSTAGTTNSGKAPTTETEEPANESGLEPEEGALSKIPGYAKFRKEASARGISFVSTEALNRKMTETKKDTFLYAALIIGLVVVVIFNAFQVQSLSNRNTTLANENAAIKTNYTNLLEADKQLQAQNSVLSSRNENAKAALSRAYDILNGAAE